MDPENDLSKKEKSERMTSPEELRKGAKKLFEYFQIYIHSLQLFNSDNIPRDIRDLSHLLYFLCLDIKDRKEPTILKRVILKRAMLNRARLREFDEISMEDIAEEQRIMEAMMEEPTISIPILLQYFRQQPEDKDWKISFRSMASHIAKELDIDFPLNVDAVEKTIEKIRDRPLDSTLNIFLRFEKSPEALVANMVVLQTKHGKTRKELEKILGDIGIPTDIAAKRLKQAEELIEKKDKEAFSG